MAVFLGCGNQTTHHPSAGTSPPRERWEAGEAMIAEAGLSGCFVLRTEGREGLLLASPDLVDRRFIPASTFKIPNSLIGLETGVITGIDFMLPWDGVSRTIEAWNQDHDLTSALAYSVVPYYQEVARRIGRERMAEWVTRLDYGNADIGDRVDVFWLEGPMAISAREQVAFIERLTSGELPVSEQTFETLRTALPSRPLEDSIVRAKTGTYVGDETSHAWLVGWVERAGAVTGQFALLLQGQPDDAGRLQSARWELTLRLLELAKGSHPVR